MLPNNNAALGILPANCLIVVAKDAYPVVDYCSNKYRLGKSAIGDVAAYKLELMVAILVSNVT